MQRWFEKMAAKPERAIVFLSLVLLLAGNWIMPLTDRDETRFAEASREMIQRADYVVPWFNGAWRFDKPILIYWCQSACYRVLGENDFAARLPSVLFTTATALLLVRWGRKLADAKTGFLAGAMFLGGLHVIIIGRVATADMAMVFFSTLAVWSGWELTRPENGGRKLWWWIFYVTLALGFLAKGPVAWLPLGGVILGRILRKDSFRLPIGETMVGLCIAVALAALWGIPAMEQTQGQFLAVGMGQHVVFRSVGVIDGHGSKRTSLYILSWALYFLTFLISFFPWTTRRPEGFSSWWSKPEQSNLLWKLLAKAMRAMMCMLYIPIKIWRWWPTRKQDVSGWYLLGQAWIVFLVFSLVRTKLPHYTMPAFPSIALWLAIQIGREGDAFAWFSKRFAGMAIFILVVMLGFFSVARHYILTENLWDRLRPEVRGEMKVGCFDYTEPSLVWKFRSVVTNTVTLGSAKQEASFLTNTPPYILVLPTKDLTNLPAIEGTQIRVHGLDMVKFKNWDLTAIVRP